MTPSPPRPTSEGWTRVRLLLLSAGILTLLGAAMTYLLLKPRSAEPGPGAVESWEEQPQVPWFVERSREADLRFRHRSGFDGEHYWFPEIVCGGVGLLDYDGDGFLDVYFVQAGSFDRRLSGGAGNQLHRNRGDGSFEEVTAAAGVGDTGYGMGCACGDFDGDGHVDLYVTNVGPNVLYRNNGDGSFSDVSRRAGVADPGVGSSAAFVDYDTDGDLDLIVVNYVRWSKDLELDCYSPLGLPDYCQPNNYDLPAPDTLYRNNGNGTFTDVSEEAGLRAAFGNGLGVACGDLDGDGRIDLYVANDSMANQLWIQTADHRFVDRALLSGVALNQQGAVEAGMGVVAIDADHDGDLDLFLSHLRDETNTFYGNRDGVFDDLTDALGLGAASLHFTGFGLACADLDNDGHLDIYVANGRVLRPDAAGAARDPYAEPNQLFRGLPDGGFRELLPRGGTAELLVATARGAAFGDLDNDGDIDIVVVNRDSEAHLLRNEAGSRGNWIIFRVLDARGRHALHSRVKIEVGGRTLWRAADRAYSYCSSNDPRVHFGLGPATTVESVTVRWPDGEEEAFGPFTGGEIHELRRRQGR